MNLSFSHSSNSRTLPLGEGRRHSFQAGFTMVEIAISLAVIGFGLVAIIGVLPAGLNVQRDNRQETIINQDATVLMEAIRNGARVADDLTNYVFAITNYWTRFDINGVNTNVENSGFDGYTCGGSHVTSVAVNENLFPINGTNVVGLLTTPRFTSRPGVTTFFFSNYVVAYVRAISGSAVEKPPQDNSTVLESAFAYRLLPEILSVPWYETNSLYGKNLQANLHELRLTFRWPLLPNGTTGNGKQTFSTEVGGVLTNVMWDALPTPLYFFVQPQTFAHAP